MSKITSPEALKSYREELEKSRQQKVVAVCTGSGCKAKGSVKVVEAFQAEIKNQGLDSDVSVRATGCQGFCEQGNLVQFLPDGVLYQKVKAEDVNEIVSKTLKGGEYLDKFFFEHPETKEKIKLVKDIPFFKNQKRIILDRNLLVDPSSIDDYIAIGGYASLVKAFDMGGDKVLEEIKTSVLRGRGGGGFPTGRKWESCRKTESSKRYVICNANEGDPGECMDRTILEGNPHSVIEGMLIGAMTIGSDEGYIYIKHEYTASIKSLTTAIEQAREKGLLGQNILGKGLNFDIKIVRGGGAFVCGESTALMAAIEGKPGEPRAKHIHTVESGLNEKPSNLNNVETWANVPQIIENGAKWYADIGTRGSGGTKVFSLVGKVNNTGLVEVPMGTSIRQIVYDVGGGIRGGKEFKAIHAGGPSGGCFPKEKLDMAVDCDTLWEDGSMLGGDMVVLDESDCMVDLARHYLNYLKDESCGKCTTCREGLRRLSALVDDIAEGRGTEETLNQIEKIADTVEAASLCALGTTSTYPLRSTLKYFRSEYEAHIKDKKCPAGVCT